MPILILVMICNIIGFGLPFPLLPLFREQFAISDMAIGHIVFVFAVANMFGSLFFGILSDKIGRKKALAIPLFLLAIVYYFTGLVDTYERLLILRVLAGFLTGNFAVVFAATSDLSTAKTRFKYMGMIGASFGVGFILGPVLGGLLVDDSRGAGTVSFALPFNVSALFALIAGSLTLLKLKETLIAEERTKKVENNIYKQFIEVYSHKRILFFTFLTLIFTSTMSGLQIYMGLWLFEIFKFNTTKLGLYWSGTAIILTITQLLIVRIFKTKTALIVGFLMYATGFIFLIYTNNYTLLLPTTLILFIGMGIITPSVNTQISFQGGKNQQGLIFGMNQSIGGLGRAIGPNIFGLLYVMHHNIMWGSMAALSLFLATIVFLFLPSSIKYRHKI